MPYFSHYNTTSSIITPTVPPNPYASVGKTSLPVCNSNSSNSYNASGLKCHNFVHSSSNFPYNLETYNNLTAETTSRPFFSIITCITIGISICSVALNSTLVIDVILGKVQTFECAAGN